MTTLDTLSAWRRSLSDPLGLTGRLLAATAGSPVRFHRPGSGHFLPGDARRVQIHLIWHRELAIDLAEPFGDGALVWRGETGRQR